MIPGIEPAGGVDGQLAVGPQAGGYLDDHPVANAHVGHTRRRARAVDDRTAANQ